MTDATTDATVTPGNVYYFEVTVPSGSVSIAYNSASVYEKGQMYIDGTAYPNRDMAFYVYGCKYDTGTYESEVIDLTTAPTIATLTFSQTLNAQTVIIF